MKYILFLFLLSCPPPTKQLWENCQYDECDDSLYCVYAENARLNTEHFFCTKICSEMESCPSGPENFMTECKILVNDEGICLIPCSYETESGCPENMNCIDTESLNKRYCW